MRRLCHLLLTLWLAIGAASNGAAETVQVAVAANFMVPMRLIAQAFEADTGHQTVLAFGATGKLYAQIKNGAPFDLLLAADEYTPTLLANAGLGLPEHRFSYATGRLALWSALPGLVDDQGRVLQQTGSGKIALADPRLAPYGNAAIEVMTRLGVVQGLRSRFVQGESISQAHQFVATGNAAMGFVALSQIMSGGRLTQGSAWIVPASLHSPIRQDAILLARGKNNAAAIALLAYLRQPKAQTIIRASGYEL